MTAARRRPTAADIDAAADLIRGLVRRTPLVRSDWLSTVTGADVWLKLETSQDTGSFKLRGAMNAIACLKAAQPGVTTVMAASAGNHGLGLATAARQFGLAARIHLPRTAPRAKRDGLARLGADLVEADTYDAAEANALKERAAGATFVSAYSDPDVIAGAGTVALEILADEASIDTFIVPIGGGGLVSGIALAVKARRPEARVIAAEAAASPVWRHALAAGRLVTVEVHETIADGLAGNIELDSITFEIVRDLVDRVVDVEEPAFVSARRELMSRDRIRAEGAAAAAAGALLQEHQALGLTGRKVAVVLSGSNTDH